MGSSEFRAARDFLLTNAEDYETAYRDFRWPSPGSFNWALDWFDGVLAAETPDATALWIVEEDTGGGPPGQGGGNNGPEGKYTFAELSRRSSQVAGWLRAQGVNKGDRILLMLGNRVELWETMLAAMKLGAGVIPASTLLGPADLADRLERGAVRHVVVESALATKFADLPNAWTPITVGDPVPGWLSYGDAYAQPYELDDPAETRTGDTLLLYFTSGTTALPKLVEHTYASYPVGHLSTMYWIGLRPGDVHLNVSSPGWAKHAYSNVFAPWNAGACVLVYNFARFSAPALLDVMRRCEVTTFCAPPTVLRMMIQEDLSAWSLPLRTAVAAGEPLNPEVIDQVRKAWGITIRDGYGQTETTLQIGNSPGLPVRPGSMGKPMPGFHVVLADPTGSGAQGDDGEICLDLSPEVDGVPAGPPVGLTPGYRDDPERTAEATKGGLYHTGDVATRDADGYITYVGRTDDVFKASDYRISPFELESALLEHPAVAEAAVVPSPDPLRLAVPKAYVALAAGYSADAETARSILAFGREHLAPYKRVRIIEFADLPKTISGKIRRVELRAAAEHSPGVEYRED